MVAIMSGADNGFFYAGQVMHFSSPFTVFLIYHKQKNQSTFEILMELKVDQHDFYVEFQSYYHPDLQQHLLSSLMTIQEYMIEKNGDVEFHLELKHGQTD